MFHFKLEMHKITSGVLANPTERKGNMGIEAPYQQNYFTFPHNKLPSSWLQLPSSHGYGVPVSQHIHYAWTCTKYGLIFRAIRLTNILLVPGYGIHRLKSPLRKL